MLNAIVTMISELTSYCLKDNDMFRYNTRSCYENYTTY